MSVASGASIIAGVALIATGVGSGVGTYLIASGASSIIGGLLNEKQGGSFQAGWLGGAVSGLFSALGFGAAGALYEASTIAYTTGEVLQYGLSAFAVGGAGAGSGAFASDVIVQFVDTGEVDLERAAKNGAYTGGIMSLATPIAPIPGILSEAIPALGAVANTLVEFAVDAIGGLVSEGVERILFGGGIT